MARIVCTARVFPETRVRLAAHGTVVHPEQATPWLPAALLAHLIDAEAVMAFMTDRVDRTFLDAAPRLRVLACALKGYDNIDVAACRARGVAVSIVPDLLTSPTAELAVALTLGLARGLREGDAAVRAGFEGWRPSLYGMGLDGATVAILGLGALGSAIAARLAPFGCALRGVDPVRTVPGVRRMTLQEALVGADVVICALPLTPATRGLIGAAALRLLPPHALVVNIGRGSVVVEAEVLEALEAHRLGGYAADVFEMEDWALEDRPRAIAPGLLAHSATLFTPHLGSATLASRRAIEARAAENIIDALEGRTPRDAL